MLKLSSSLSARCPIPAAGADKPSHAFSKIKGVAVAAAA